MKNIKIYFTYYVKRLVQKILFNDFSIPFRTNSEVLVSDPPGSVLKFALDKDGNKDLKLIIDELSDGDTFFDVGANFGLYSLSVYDRFGGQVEIHCFEPEMEAFRRLINTRKLNQANWNCHHFGFGAQEGWLNITSEFGGYNHITQDSKNTQKIRVFTLDQYVAETGIEKIDMLKIDVEGFEIFVLKGASRTLENKMILKVLFEVDDHQSRYGVKEEEYTAYLSKFGYKRRNIENVNFQIWEL